MKTMEPADIAGSFSRKARNFREEAYSILSKYEDSTTRVISLDLTRVKLKGLNLKQDELFRQAIICAEYRVYRAAHVMAWSAFMDYIEERLYSDKFQKLHNVFPKWNKYKTIDDLREDQSDHNIIDAAMRVGLLKKGEMKSLHGHLSTRNDCAHPSSYNPGLNEAVGYVSDLLNRIDDLETRNYP